MLLSFSLARLLFPFLLLLRIVVVVVGRSFDRSMIMAQNLEINTGESILSIELTHKGANLLPNLLDEARSALRNSGSVSI